VRLRHIVVGLIALSSAFANDASAGSPCPAMVVFGSGIWTDPKEAELNARLLRIDFRRYFQEHGKDIPKECFAYASVTPQGWKDLVESANFIAQDAFRDFWRGVFGLGPISSQVEDLFVDKLQHFQPDPETMEDDLQEHLKFYRPIVASGKVVLVAHSQGNLFANEAYRRLTENENASPSSFDTVSIASPALNTPKSVAHITLAGDAILWVATLPANTQIDGTPCSPNLNDSKLRAIINGIWCHGMGTSYLLGSASRSSIFGRIASAIPSEDPPLSNTMELDATINASTSQIFFSDTAHNNILTGGTLTSLWEGELDAYHSTYPSLSGHLYSENRNPTTLDGYSGAAVEVKAAGPGDYWIKIHNVTNGRTGVVCINSPDGENAWTIVECATRVPVRPTAVDDGPFSASRGQLFSLPAPGVLSNDENVSAGATVEFLEPFPPSLAPGNPDGSFSLDLSLDSTFVGAIALHYKVHSLNGDSNIATVTVTVTPGWTGETVSGPTIQGGSRPARVADAGGNITILWQGGTRGVHASRFSVATGTWSAEQVLSGPPPPFSGDLFIRAASDSAGNILAAWRLPDGEVSPTESRWRVEFRRYLVAGDSWAPVDILPFQMTPELVGLSNGDVIASSIEPDSFDRRADHPATVKATRRIAETGTWTDTVDLSVPSAPVSRLLDQQLAIASDSEGSVSVVWNQALSPVTYVVQTARYSLGEWGARADLSAVLSTTDLTAFLEPPHVVFDAVGNAVAIWADRTYTAVTNAARFTKASGTWSIPVQISALDAYAAEHAVAAAANGDAFVVWSATHFVSSRAVHSIQVSQYHYVSGEWDAPVELMSSSAWLESPSVTVTAIGDVFSVWVGKSAPGQAVESVYGSHLANATGVWSAHIRLSVPDRNTRQSLITSSGNSSVVAWIVDEPVTDPDTSFLYTVPIVQATRLTIVP
jgi:hypothetical protein